MATLTRYVALGALFLIPLIPLYVAQTSFFPFITGKGFAFRILVEVAFVAWAALAVMDCRYRPKFSWLLAFFGAFTTWLLVADLLAINAHKALWSNFERMDGFVTLIHVFLFFLVAGTMLAAGNLWRRWWLTFLTVAALVCGYAFLQLAGGIQINQGGVRVDATFGNAIYLAVYLMFAAFIAVWQAIESRGWLRYALIALAVASVIILFNTATRGAIVAIVAGAGIAALLWMLRAGKRGRQIAGAGLVALLVVIGAFVVLKDTPFVANHPIWARVASISLSELNVRFTLWSMAAEGIKERPLIGYGQEGYNYVFSEYYRPELYSQEPWFDRAHSAYIDWLVAGGIPAFLLFLALLLMAAYLLWRTENLTNAERVLLASALAAYAIQAIVVFDNLFSYVPLVAILAYLHGKAGREIRALERLPEFRGGNVEAVIFPVAGAVLLFVILAVNAPNMRAAHHLVYAISPIPGGPAENLAHFRDALASGSFATQEIAEQLVPHTARVVNDPAAPDALKNEYVVLAIDTIERVIAGAPHDPRLRLQASLLYRMIGDYDKALVHIEAAEAASAPGRQLVLLEHAATLAMADRKEEAAVLYRRIYEESPRFERLSAQIAAGLIMSGRQVEADAILTETFGTTAAGEEVLVAAYATTKQYDRLIEVLTVIAERDPSSGARYRLATAYALAGRYADARREAQATMLAYPSTAAEGKAFLSSLPK